MEESFPNTEWIEIGTIVAPQGLQGELRVSSSSDFPERFEKPGNRWLQSPKGEPPVIVELLSGRCIPGKKIYVIQLKGIENRQNAEALRNYKLLVPQSDRPQLAADEYHVSELIGLVVYNQLTGEKLGRISDIFFSGNDIIEVELLAKKNHSEIKQELSKTKKNKSKPAKPTTILIPFVKEIVPVVDISGGRIEINPPRGLLEIVVTTNS